MPKYYISLTTQNPKRNHEIHHEDCRYLPKIENREDLGYCTNCNMAMFTAIMRGYTNVDRCIHCCRSCHKE